LLPGIPCSDRWKVDEVLLKTQQDVRIVRFAIGTDLALKSNGTNETICGRPPGSEVFIRNAQHFQFALAS
jgi:hypothetical protein